MIEEGSITVAEAIQTLRTSLEAAYLAEEKLMALLMKNGLKR